MTQPNPFNFNQRSKGISTIIGSFIVIWLTCGFFFWGNINIYVTSFYRSKGETDLDTSKAIITQVVMNFLASICMFGEKIWKGWFGIRLGIFVSGTIISLGLLCASYMPTFTWFSVCMGLGFGSQLGMVWLLPLVNAVRYFPLQKGMVTGLILVGIGLGILIINYLCFALFNPHNVKPTIEGVTEFYFDARVTDRVQSGIRYVALFTLMVTIIGSSMIYDYVEEFDLTIKNQGNNQNKDQNASQELELEQDPKKLDQEQLIKNHSQIVVEKMDQTLQEDQPPKTKKKHKNYDILEKHKEIRTPKSTMSFVGEGGKRLTFLQAMKTHVPYQLFFMSYFSQIAIAFIVNDYKNYGMGIFKDDVFLTSVGSISAVFNGLSRLVLGRVGDKLGFNKTLIYIFILEAITCFTFPSVSSYRALYIIWVCLIFIALGGQTPNLLGVMFEIFDINTAPMVMSFVFMSIPFGILTQYFMEDLKYSIEYSGIFYICGATCIIAFVLTIVLKMNKM